MNRLAWSAVAFLSVVAAVPGPSGAQTRRPITETDLFKFVWAADPQISPNGSQVAFVRVNVNEDKDRYEIQIFVVPADGNAPPRPLTAGRNDRSPRWSPDGRQVKRAAPRWKSWTHTRSRGKGMKRNSREIG